MDDSLHIPSMAVEGSLCNLRTDSMDSDSSIDSENLVSIPVSPSMMVSQGWVLNPVGGISWMDVQ